MDEICTNANSRTFAKQQLAHLKRAIRAEIALYQQAPSIYVGWVIASIDPLFMLLTNVGGQLQMEPMNGTKTPIMMTEEDAKELQQQIPNVIAVQYTQTLKALIDVLEITMPALQPCACEGSKLQIAVAIPRSIMAPGSSTAN